MNNVINVLNQDGVMVVSSRQVAEDFGKRHSEVLRKISEKLTDAKLRSLNWFIESSYEDAKGEGRLEFLMTRDGFSFIVMGFTGSKADEFKFKYIEAFNKMEEALTQQQAPMTIEDMMIHQLQETKKVKAKVETLDTKMTDFEENAPLYAVECECVSKAVRKRGVALMGGKKTSAYQNSSLRSKVYKYIYHQVHLNFDVDTHKAIKRRHYESAIELAKGIELPIVLKEEVEALNNQMSLM